MSDPILSQPPIEAPKPATRRRFGRGLVIGSVLLAGVALGAGGLAAAAAGKSFGFMHGPRLERIQSFVRMALDSAGASSDQEAKIHDIVAKSFDELAPKPGDRDEFRKQVLELLKAPTIDRAAIEKLRADQVATMDSVSKRIAQAIGDAAEVLTPDQRRKLGDMLPPGGPGGGFWHGWHRG